ncbi:hypothetical protein [Runella zeae]|uniref:hypothetical protein n=1 Tax=Runella zeae TaxID=94255 RepID=UPI00048D4B9D|nr:hypothetical protein [Runella zeae]
MKRRTKLVLGVTVALITAAALRFTVGHHGWHHHKGPHACQHHKSPHQERGQADKPQTENPSNK